MMFMISMLFKTNTSEDYFLEQYPNEDGIDNMTRMKF